MAKNIIIEKDMQELTSVNYRYNMRLPIIYRYNNLLVIGQTTIEQNKELESMGATIRESDLGHNFLCLRYSKDMQSRLHYWRNEKARQARQEALGSGWRGRLDRHLHTRRHDHSLHERRGRQGLRGGWLLYRRHSISQERPQGGRTDGLRRRMYYYSHQL